MLWVDPTIEYCEENKLLVTYFKNAFMKNNIDFEYTVDIDTAMEKTKDAVNTVIIATNGVGEIILSNLDQLDCLLSIEVFTNKIKEKN